ncbi:MAG TPA: hypothetical protein PK458_00430 [Phycisphaerae bacterium]|nr:hypothetical protein [Phycisphaerae bacterium]HPU24617.1 hypothetical protein [Phycisphaerae bacterium]
MRHRLMSIVCTWSPLVALAILPSVPAASAESQTATRPASGTAALTDDLTVWPNQTCYRASEPWLAENHDHLRVMRPRVLVLNFANDVDMAGIQERTEKLIQALAESTRYHGYEDPAAPAFLQYEVVRYVDMRDQPPPPERAHRNSAHFPTKPDGPKDFACDYSAFYSDAFARFYGFADPKNNRRYRNLHELIEEGVVHELWFYAIHEYEVGWPAFEVIEIKQCYDENFKRIEGKYVPAGNGHDDSMPWSGRTFRMAFFNPHRGPGCAMENFAHGLEAIARSRAIPYFSKYFNEYAELNLNRKYGMPFKSLYEMPYGEKDVVNYPSQTSLEVKYKGEKHVIDPYVAVGGNAHWPPGGRHHYDLNSPFTVSSTIESYRMGNGPDGKDRVADFNKDQFAQFKSTAPDCMGPWLVFWRQCMPGLDNKAKDDDGKPMKNWWPFLFY